MNGFLQGNSSGDVSAVDCERGSAVVLIFMGIGGVIILWLAFGVMMSLLSASHQAKRDKAFKIVSGKASIKPAPNIKREPNGYQLRH